MFYIQEETGVLVKCCNCCIEFDLSPSGTRLSVCPCESTAGQCPSVRVLEPGQNYGFSGNSSSSSMSSSWSESSDTSEPSSSWGCCGDTERPQRPVCSSEAGTVCLCSGLWVPEDSVSSSPLSLLPAGPASSTSLLPPAGFSWWT